MRKILTITDNIYIQALDISRELFALISSLISSATDYTLNDQQKARLFWIGQQICAYNYVTPSHIAEEYMYDGYGIPNGFDYKAGDYYITLALNLVTNIWEQEDIDLGWWERIGKPERDATFQWTYQNYQLWKMNEVDGLPS